MVNKKAVAIVSIIALIIVGVILGIRVKNLNKHGKLFFFFGCVGS